MTKPHPWMASSTPEAKAEMLAAIGVEDIEALFAQIPRDHRFEGPFGLPPQLISETALSRHLDDMMARNVPCAPGRSFLGAGAWPHYVPAICDEVANRYEWQTSVFGSPTSDHWP